VLADFVHLSALIRQFDWDRYNKGLKNVSVFAQVASDIGGAYFAIIGSAGEAGLEFDGDGTYTISIDGFRQITR
jgi:hypothetical protein